MKYYWISFFFIFSIPVFSQIKNIETKENNFFFYKKDYLSVVPIAEIPKWIFSEEENFWKLVVRDGYQASFFVIKKDGSYETINLKSFTKAKKNNQNKKKSDFSLVYRKTYNYLENVEDGFTINKGDFNSDSLSVYIPFNKEKSFSFNGTKNSKEEIDFYLRYYDKICIYSFNCNLFYGKIRNLAIKNNYTFFEEKRIKGLSSSFSNKNYSLFYSYGESDFLDYDTFSTFSFSYDGSYFDLSQYYDQNNESEIFLRYLLTNKWLISFGSDYRDGFIVRSSYNYGSNYWGLKNISSSFLKEQNLEVKDLSFLLSDGYFNKESNIFSNGLRFNFSDTNFLLEKESNYNISWIGKFRNHRFSTSYGENYLNDEKITKRRKIGYSYKYSQLWNFGAGIRNDYLFDTGENFYNSELFIEGINRNSGISQKYATSFSHREKLESVQRGFFSASLRYDYSHNISYSLGGRYNKSFVSDEYSYGNSFGLKYNRNDSDYSLNFSRLHSPSNKIENYNIVLNFVYKPDFKYKNISEILATKDVIVCVFFDENFNLKKDKDEFCRLDLNSPVYSFKKENKKFVLEKISNKSSFEVFLEQSLPKDNYYFEPLRSGFVKSKETEVDIPIQKFYYKKINFKNNSSFIHEAIPINIKCDIDYSDSFYFYGNPILDIKIPLSAKECFLSLSYLNWEDKFELNFSSFNIIKERKINYKAYSSLNLIFRDKKGDPVYFKGQIKGIGFVESDDLGFYKLVLDKKGRVNIPLTNFKNYNGTNCKFNSLDSVVFEKAEKKIKKIICN